MAKKITQDQIIQSNIWENTIKSTNELIAQVDLLQAELKKVSQASAEIVKNSAKPTFQGIKQTNEETNNLNKS